MVPAKVLEELEAKMEARISGLEKKFEDGLDGHEKN